MTIDSDEYYKIIRNCSKCAMCRNMSPWDMQSMEFKDICPSGTRFLFEAYFAPGKMEITRALLDNEIQYSDRLEHIIFACPLCGGCQAQCDEVNIIKPLDVLQELRIKYVKAKGPIAAHAKFAESIKELLHYLGVSRHLERIADLITNIAEDIIYMIEGKIVRHHVEDYKNSMNSE